MKAANAAISALVAALVYKQADSDLDFPAIRALVAMTVDVIQYRPQSESTTCFHSLTDISLVVSLMILILPALSISSSHSSENQEWQRSTSSAVMSFATASPAVFKEVLRRMDADGRRRLESILRTALEEGQDAKTEELSKPSILLKSDFGSVD